MSQTPEQRETALQPYREMVAFLEKHPHIPVPTHSTLFAFILRAEGPETDRFNTLFDIADVFDAPVVQDPDGDRKTERHFGSLTLAVVAQAGNGPKEQRRVVTRPTAAAESGECLDERMRSVA